MGKSTVEYGVLGLEKLDGLDPEFRVQAKKVIELMRARGWKLQVVWGRRTKQENDPLVEKKVASPISRHLDGKAVDLIDRDVKWSNDKNHQYYRDLEEITANVGVQWGGKWTNPWDPCHFEAKQ